MAKPPPVGPPPDVAILYEAALRYLARYNAPAASVTRVLRARVLRWARATGADEAELAPRLASVAEVVDRLVAARVVDDAAYAEGRTRRLQRAGRSRRAITAHLQAKGVSPDLAELPDDPAAEIAAALLYLGRRRLGPFRRTPDPEARSYDLARLARAGFSAGTAHAVLALSHEAAEQLLLEARQG